jgi:hypothetical protein
LINDYHCDSTRLVATACRTSSTLYAQLVGLPDLQDPSLIARSPRRNLGGSESTVRRALKALEKAARMDRLEAIALALLSAPRVVDTDGTVMPLYGKQEGAVSSYIWTGA